MGGGLLLRAVDGYAVVVAAVMKVPQLLLVWRYDPSNKRTTTNYRPKPVISTLSLTLELACYMTILSYSALLSYPMLQYAEYIILTLQDIVLLVLVSSIEGELELPFFARFTVLLVFELALAFDVFADWFVSFVIVCVVPASAASKVLQLVSILREHDSTGVSVSSWVLSASTSVARIVTIMNETQDRVLLTHQSVSILLCLAVAAAAFFYRREKIE